MIFFLALRGLNLTCDDIMFCICRVNGGLKTESNIPGVYRERSWSWRCGGESRNPQKHTQSMSRQMQRDTFLVQQTCQTKCVRSSSEIEVNDILLLVLSWISCWIFFFIIFFFFCLCDDGEENKSQPPFPLLSLHGVITQASDAATPSAYMTSVFSLFCFLRFLGLSYSYWW